MPRTFKLLAAFMVLAAVGCAKPKPGDPPHSKVGVAVAPPPGQTVNYDPSVIGLGAAIGTTVYDSQGVILWLKYGAPLTAWRAVPVSPLVTGDPSISPGLKAPIGFTVTMNDGSASWVKSTSSDTGWVTNPPTGVATMPDQTVEGNVSGGVATPSNLTATQLATMLATGNPGAALGEYSAVVDLTAPAATYQVIPPTVGRLNTIFGGYKVVSTNTPTVAPTIQGGANAANNDVWALQALSSILTNAAGNRTSIPVVTVAGQIPLVDLSLGFFVKIVTPATAVALTVRFYFAYSVLPLN